MFRFLMIDRCGTVLPEHKYHANIITIIQICIGIDSRIKKMLPWLKKKIACKIEKGLNDRG